jgi:hypothetical protein
MERSRFSRLTGVIYVVGALFGLVISIGSLFLLWTTRADVTRDVNATVNLMSRTLDATRDTIQVVGSSLGQASTDLELIRGIIQDVALTLDDSTGLITSTAGLVGGDMTSFVRETQISLASVEASARLVDDTLRIVSIVPFIGPRYQPEVPLQESVASVSRSLDPLPASFGRISRELDVSAANLSVIQYEIELLVNQLDGIHTSITSAQLVVEEYRLILVELRSSLDGVENRLPAMIDTVYLAITALLISMLITQLGMLVHGIALLG